MNCRVLLLACSVVCVLPAIAAAQEGNLAAALAQAEAAFERGDALAAARAYSAVLAIDTDHPRALYRLAQLRRDDPRAAIVLLERYVRVEPSDAWGHLALAEALARSGRADAASRAYADARALEPRDRDIRLGGPRLFGRLGRLREAIDGFEAWLADHPDDHEAWHELAAVLQRAGRPFSAVNALERARSLSPDEGMLDARIDALRARTAPAIQVGVDGSGETGASARGMSAGIDVPGSDRSRIGLWYQRRRVASFGDVAQGHRLRAGVTARPRPDLHLNASAGAMWTAAPPLGASTPQPELAFRLRRTGPAEGLGLDVRAQRNAVDVTPELLRNPLSRTQLSTSVDVPLGRSWRLRGHGRTALLVRGDERNTRTGVGGGAARTIAPGLRLAGQWQHTANSNPEVRSHFAPAASELVDVGLEIERESDRLALSLDLGAGIQRFTRVSGHAMGPWAPASRAWGALTWTLSPRRQLLFEFETYDSQVADVVLVAERWRYASLTASLRLALR